VTSPYKLDRLAEEKPDPHEASSTRFLALPLALWSGSVMFGCVYLALNTERAVWIEGDQRTARVESSEHLATSQGANLGADLYKRHCQACHQPSGLGVGNAFPPLQGSEWVLGPPELVPAIVWHGVQGEIEVKGKVYKGVMPAFKGRLEPGEIAAIASYVRTSWGNQASPLTAEVVQRVVSQRSYGTPRVARYRDRRRRGSSGQGILSASLSR
jgi:mono/diheme cytochrome c family protein